MLTALAQATEQATEQADALGSVAGILVATFVLVALLKQLLPGLRGRATLLVVLAVASGLTCVALFVTKSLVEQPITAFLAVFLAVAGAAGIDVAGATVLKGTAHKSPKALVPVALVFAMSGCATPSQQWAVQRESVSATQDVIVDLHSAEMISDQDVLDVAPWVQAARTEVNLAYLQLPDGGPTFDSQLNRAADFVALIRQTLYGATYAGNQSTDER